MIKKMGRGGEPLPFFIMMKNLWWKILLFALWQRKCRFRCMGIKKMQLFENSGHCMQHPLFLYLTDAKHCVATNFQIIKFSNHQIF